MVKNPDNLVLSVLNGHACLASGTYKYALGIHMFYKLLYLVVTYKFGFYFNTDEYLSACKMDPENPLFLLLSAVVLV